MKAKSLADDKTIQDFSSLIKILEDVQKSCIDKVTSFGKSHFDMLNNVLSMLCLLN